MRKSGDGGKTRVVEIPLDRGIRSFGTGYEIGIQPRVIQNMVRKARTGVGRYLDWAPALEGTPVATLTNKGDPAHTNKYLLGIGYFDTVAMAFGAYDTGAGAVHLGAWEVLANDARHGASSVAIADDTNTMQYPAAWAYWPRQNILYYSHANSGGLPRQWNGAAESSYTAYNALAGAVPSAAMIVHLDRLYLATAPVNALTTGGWRSTTIYFTDPDDPATIRATSVVRVPDQVRAFGRVAVGGLDAAAQAHLVVGGVNALHVLDGDPRAGNAILRLLSDQVGVQSPTHMAETRHGLFVLGTDGLLYLIPRGASDLLPVGLPIRNAFTVGFTRVPYASAPYSLVWHDPYLHVVFQLPSSSGNYILDMTDPSAPEWTGPHLTDAAPSMMGAIRIAETSASEARVFVAEQGNATGMRVYELDDDVTGTQKIETGYLYDPGHDVQLVRAIATVARKVSGNQARTFTCFRPDGTFVAATATPATTTASQTMDKVAKIVFAFPTHPHGEYLWFRFDGTGHLDLQRLAVEIAVQPLQHSRGA